MAQRASARVVARVHQGIYRFIFRNVATPERYAKHIQRLWNMLHSTGTRRIVLASDHSADSFVEDWAGHHPLLCTVTVHTMVGIFQVMGLNTVRATQLECVARGGARCHTRLQWDD